jgi:hypothetical protein
VIQPIRVDAQTVHDLFTDQLGVCLACGEMSDPVPNDALGKLCDTCGKPCLVGMTLAVECGAVRVDMERAA